MLPDDLAAALGALRDRRPGLRLDVRWHAAVTSTMDVAANLAAAGAEPGVVVGADQQTAGRGRRGHAWESPPAAGLYFSFIARPPLQANASLPLLTLAAGVAVRDGVLAAVGWAPQLKWPNDVMVGRRKLAGILAEGLGVGTPAQAVVIGVGLNLLPSAYPPEVVARATSLEAELGRAVDRGQVLAEVLAALTDRLATLAGSPGDILQAWRAASPSATGTRVEWDGRTGTTAGIDESGALLIRTPSGIERVIAGEVHWHLGTNP
ncbi:MAG: biotin--[acetyl-CoA-carboxylase] ligase [Vicinamibacterales bacterium]|jgi:BirA family biotin operon repressor/biotin-[acetyl-CoA-carboxylase] ligase